MDETMTAQQGRIYASTVKQPKGWAKLCAAFGLVLVVLFVQGFAMIFGMISASDDAMIASGEIAGGVAALLFVYALGGKKLATPSLEGMGEAWRVIKWIFIADALIAVIDLVAVIADGSLQLAQLWGLRVVMLALMCAGIGLFEEATFRGLALHGLLARMGTSTKGMVWAVVLSSLLFGLLHIDPTSIDLADPSHVAQAVLKVAQTGIFGFVAAAVVLKTGNLWPVALLHGLNDFMLMLVGNGLMSNPVTTDYVSSGSDGLLAIVIYLVLCLAYLPSAISAARILKEHPVPDRGQFYRARVVPIYSVVYPAAYAPVPASHVASPAAYTPTPANYAASPADYAPLPAGYAAAPAGYASAPAPSMPHPAGYVQAPASAAPGSTAYAPDSAAYASSAYGSAPDSASPVPASADPADPASQTVYPQQPWQ